MIKFVALSLLLVGIFTADPVRGRDECSFEGHARLKCYNMTMENLPLPENIFANYIAFIWSDIPVLKKEYLQSFPNVEYAHMKYTKLEKIEDDAFSVLKKLFFVDISRNQLTSISPNLFQDCPRMNDFNISYNPLVIPKNAPFLNAPTIQFLSMDGIGIKELYSETFMQLGNVRYLSLAYNELTTIPSNTFKPLKHLIELELSNNHLKTISIELEGKTYFLGVGFYLENNPWECDCALYRSIDWMKNNHRIKDDPRCLTPQDKKWKEIENLNCQEIAAH